MTKTMRYAREAVLWVGAALGSLCLLALLAGWMFNITPLVFSSGSMSPAYDAGALGIAREVPADELAVGDVVSVVNAEGVRVTHRIVDLQRQGDRALLSLQGDTNDVADAELYPVTSADRVGFGLPYAGYALNAAASPFGLLLAGLFVIGVLWLGFGRRDVEDGAPAPSRARLLVPMGIAGVLLAGTGVGASGQAPWAFTSAFWTDSATATTTASTPAAVAPAAPTITACVNTANGSAPYRLTWTWPGPGNPDSFAVVYSVNPGGTRVTTFAGTLRTGLTVDINNEAGNFKLVAITGGVQSVVSNQANYQGNGGGKSCSVVP